MNQKKTFLIITLAFAVLLAGAYILYTHLGQSLAPDQLAVQGQQETTSAASFPAREPETTQEYIQETEPPQETAPASISAPDFTVYDKDGNAVMLSDYIGKPIVLNFWASWCGPCQMEMPDFHEKHQELGEDITFLMVNMTDGSRETVAGASAFISERGYGFPVLFDTESHAAAAYGVYSLPTTFFIDAEGNAIAQATGAINAETLQRGIDMIT